MNNIMKDSSTVFSMNDPVLQYSGNHWSVTFNTLHYWLYYYDGKRPVASLVTIQGGDTLIKV